MLMNVGLDPQFLISKRANGGWAGRVGTLWLTDWVNAENALVYRGSSSLSIKHGTISRGREDGGWQL